MNHGHSQDGRISQGYGADRADEWLSRRQVAGDLGIGMSTLKKWVTAHRDTDVVPPEDYGLARENERLRRENRILREERDIEKKATQFFASQKP